MALATEAYVVFVTSNRRFNEEVSVYVADGGNPQKVVEDLVKARDSLKDFVAKEPVGASSQGRACFLSAFFIGLDPGRRLFHGRRVWHNKREKPDGTWPNPVNAKAKAAKEVEFLYRVYTVNPNPDDKPDYRTEVEIGKVMSEDIGDALKEVHYTRDSIDVVLKNVQTQAGFKAVGGEIDKPV